MELLVILIPIVVVVLPIVALVRALAAGRAVKELAARVGDLEFRFAQAAPAAAPAAAPSAAAELLRRVHEVGLPAAETAPVLPPPLPPPRPEQPWRAPAEDSAASAPDVPPPASEAGAGGTWESLFGARLFAWVGGFALFLAAAYGLKYSIDHNLLPPAVRVLLGLLTGAGLVAGGLFTDRRGYRVTAQALVGTGIVVAYAACYVGHALYRLAPFTSGVTLGLLAGVTAAAIGLALRLQSPGVAALGSLAGFITPFLLPQGLESPLARFTYIGLLNAGLLAVVLRRGWGWLAPLAGLGTAATLGAGLHTLGDAQRTGVALALLGLFGGAAWWHARSGAEPDEAAANCRTTKALPDMPAGLGLALGFAVIWLLGWVVGGSLALRPQNTAATVGLLLLAGALHGTAQQGLARRPASQPWVLLPAVGLAVLLGIWVSLGSPALHPAWLPAAVVMLMLTGRSALQPGEDTVSDRPNEPAPRLIALAGTTIAAAVPLLIALLNPQFAGPGWVFLGLALLAAWLLAGARRLDLPVLAPAAVLVTGVIVNVWALSATGPAAYAELLPGVRRLLEEFSRPTSWSAPAMLAWLAGFAVVLTILPPRLRRADDVHPAWWTAAAAAGPLMLLPLLGVVRQAWPGVPAALVPLALAMPAGVVAWRAGRSLSSEGPPRLTALAWLWGAVLLLLTVALPLQLDRQWLTIGFALEGAALLALFRRVPHAGLVRAGTAVLAGAFARLILNPDVVTWGLPDGLPVFNGLLYPFAVVIAALYAGARLSDDAALPHGRRLLLALGTTALFALVNLQIAHFFTPPGRATLDLSFTGNLARDMSYTLAWSAFALGLVIVGLRRDLRPARLAGAVLFGAALLKLFLHDLARLDNLYRIGALFGVAVVALAASTLYQRFFRQRA